MSYELSGTIKQIGELQEFSSGFTKREFVVKTTWEEYPQDIPLEFVKDKCSKLDAYKPGDEVTVHFNLRGREWKDRHFINLNAWRIQSLRENPNQGSDQPPPRQPASAPKQPAFMDQDDGEDVPF